VRWTVALVLMGAMATTGDAQPAVADSIRRLDSAWARTYAVHDTALALSLLSDRIVITSANGRMKDKATEIGDVRPAPGLEMKYFRTTDVRIDVYPGTGIVTGVAEWAFTSNGRESSLRRRYTAVYVRGARLGWQMAALHMGQSP
jgi:ketosteroid isomerase-like protein